MADCNPAKAPWLEIGIWIMIKVSLWMNIYWKLYAPNLQRHLLCSQPIVKIPKLCS